MSTTVYYPRVRNISFYDNNGVVYDDDLEGSILAVSHDCFRDLDLRALVPQPGVIYDVKGMLPRNIIDARL